MESIQVLLDSCFSLSLALFNVEIKVVFDSLKEGRLSVWGFYYRVSDQAQLDSNCEEKRGFDYLVLLASVENRRSVVNLT
jgi:hypothetical protein